MTELSRYTKSIFLPRWRVARQNVNLYVRITSLSPTNYQIGRVLETDKGVLGFDRWVTYVRLSAIYLSYSMHSSTLVFFFVYREVANYSTASKGVAIQTESRNVTSIKIRRTIKFLRSKRKSRKSRSNDTFTRIICIILHAIRQSWFFFVKGLQIVRLLRKGARGCDSKMIETRDFWVLRLFERSNRWNRNGQKGCVASIDVVEWYFYSLSQSGWRGDPGLSRHESAPRLLDASVYVLQRVARDRWKVWCARSVERCWSLIHFEKKDKNEEEERNFNFVRVVRNTTTSINGGIINRFSRASVKRLRAKEGNTTPQERGGGCPISGDACEKRWNYVNILQTTITTRRD